MRLPSVFLILLLLLACRSLLAQQGDSNANEKWLFQCKILPPAFSVEKTLQTDITASFTLGALFLLSFEEYPGTKPFGYNIQPVFASFEARKYISNLEQKSSENYPNYRMGAYGGMKTSAYYFPNNDEWIFYVGPVIGYQLIAVKKLLLNISIGPGMYIVEGDILFGPAGSVSVGLKLNKNLDREFTW